MPHDVFISHSSKDKTVADATCGFLEAKGIRCWVAPRDIRPGASWGASIIKAIREARVMILIFSSHANASPQIKREVERAVHAGATIIPMRVEEVLPEEDLEYFLGTPHWLDAFTPPLEHHLERLSIAIHDILEISPPPVASKPVQENMPKVVQKPVAKSKTQRIPELISETKRIDVPKPIPTPEPQKEREAWEQDPQSAWEKLRRVGRTAAPGTPFAQPRKPSSKRTGLIAFGVALVVLILIVLGYYHAATSPTPQPATDAKVPVAGQP